MSKYQTVSPQFPVGNGQYKYVWLTDRTTTVARFHRWYYDSHTIVSRRHLRKMLLVVGQANSANSEIISGTDFQAYCTDHLSREEFMCTIPIQESISTDFTGSIAYGDRDIDFGTQKSLCTIIPRWTNRFNIDLKRWIISSHGNQWFRTTKLHQKFSVIVE